MSRNIDDKLATIEKIKTLKNIEPLDLLIGQKKILINEYLIEKFSNPKQTQAQICSRLGISRSTLARTRTDLSLPSFSRYLTIKKVTKHTTGVSKEKPFEKEISSQTSQASNDVASQDLVLEEPKPKPKKFNSRKEKGGFSGEIDENKGGISERLNYINKTLDNMQA